MIESNDTNILQVLKSIFKISQSLTGTDYLKQLIQNISVNLDIKYVFIGHAIDKTLTKVQTDVVYANGKFVNNFIYDLKDTPCQMVLSGKRVCIHDKDVANIFPEDTLLKEMGVESYVGAPVLSNNSADSTSILVLLDDKEMYNKDFFNSITELLAMRASAENRLINYDKKLTNQNIQLNNKNQQFEDIINNINDFVWEVDINGKYIYVSPQINDILGYKNTEILGKTPFDLMHKKQKKTIQKKFINIVQKHKQIIQLKNENIHKDGHVVYLETSGTPIFDEDNKLIGYRGIDRDITKRVLSEKELAKNHQKIQKLNEQLKDKVILEEKKNEENEKILFEQSKMAAMGEMIENIAHQWKQPLSIISTSASGIEVQNEMNMLEQNDIQTAMKHINSSVQHLAQTVDNFRDFFKRNKEKEYFLIQTAFQKTFLIITAQLKNANLTIEKNIEDITLHGVERELIQVFINILNNARDELIKKNIPVKYISINTLTTDATVKIHILDNAGGISSSNISKIFDSHFTTKRDTDGTGIGLYMSKMIIEESWKGLISVQNKSFTYDKQQYTGAEFTIELPLMKKNIESNHTKITY